MRLIGDGKRVNAVFALIMKWMEWKGEYIIADGVDLCDAT